MPNFAVPQVAAPDPAALEAREAVALAFRSSPEYLATGALGQPAEWLAACQGAVPPAPLHKVRAIAFLSRNGIGKREVSAFAPEATQELAERIEAGVGPMCTLARNADVSVSLMDPGVECGAIDVADGLPAAHMQAALQAGAAAADQEVDSGADLLIPIAVGVGNTTVAAAIMGRLLRIEPVKIIGPGSGVTDELWKHKVTVIRDAMFRARHLDDPLDLLQVLGSHSLAAAAGFILQAAARRTPLLIDDAWTATAAALAYRLAPELPAWILPVGDCAEPAYHQALADMGLEPFTHMQTRGGGIAALSVVPMLRNSIELAADACATSPAAE